MMSQECRFRTLRGEMTIIAPDGVIETRPVEFIWDEHNHHIGIRFVGESEFKNYIVFTPWARWEDVKRFGNPTQTLETV